MKEGCQVPERRLLVQRSASSHPLSSPAPPSLVPGHFGLVGTVAAIVAFPTLTILGLDRSNSIYRWLVPELQSPPLALCHSCGAAVVPFLENTFARRVVLVCKARLLQGRVSPLVETGVAGGGAHGRWGHGRADHSNWGWHAERKRGAGRGSSGRDGERELGFDGS